MKDKKPVKRMPVWFIGVMTSPLWGIILLGVFPVPFVRLAGCTGNLNGLAVKGKQLVVADRVFMSGKRRDIWQVEKVTIRDAATGDRVAGPWVHDQRGWVGLLGELYCVSGESLECASLKDGTIAASRATLEAKDSRLAGHWLNDPDAYRPSRAGDRVIFRTDDGRIWQLTQDLALSETSEGALEKARGAAAEGEAEVVPRPQFVGKGRERFQLGTGEPSQQSWLEPKFLTGRIGRSPPGWLISSAERRVYGAPEGLAISFVNEQGVEVWKTPIGDHYHFTETHLIGEVAVVRSSGDHSTLRALDLATGKQLWSKSFNLW